MTPTIHLSIPDDQWRPADENDPSRPHLTGPIIVINGLQMHLEAWRVDTDGRGIQEAVESDMQQDFADLHNAVHGDGPFTTTTIDGMEYILIASPFCR